MSNTVSGTQVPRFSVAVEALRQCLGIDAKQLVFLFNEAKHNQSDLLIEMRNREKLTAPHLTDRAVAKISNLEFLAIIDPARIRLRPDINLIAAANLRVVTYEIEPGVMILLLSARENDLPRLFALRKFSNVRKMKIVIVSPQTLRSALIIATKTERLKYATFDLQQNNPDNSSYRASTASQGFIVGGLVFLIFYALIFFEQQTLQISHLIASFFFFFCVLLRMLAIPLAMQKKKQFVEIAQKNDHKNYCVLVPLHREADVIHQLITSLERLDWPKGNLQIILICEENDDATLLALQKFKLKYHFSIVVVPYSLPQTKPKALNYALSTVIADFVVIYDAEDRPHPQQLKEAYKRFCTEAPNLACLQSPLMITNVSQSYLSRLFAFEYSALFRGLLPYLSSKALFLPLGGTSNHFKMEKLKAAGAWDPFNVTEDADLGLRLRRLGFKTDTLLLPTLEDAPTELNVWIKQRTRWMKGWAQTWLVLMRRPIIAFKEIGGASFLLAQILFVGLLTSAALHFFVFLGYIMYLLFTIILGWQTAIIPSFIQIDLINFVLGYLSFFTLGVITTKIDHPTIDLKKVAFFLPIYWIFMSLTAWRAIWHLIFKPHLWEKTPHTPASTSIG